MFIDRDSMTEFEPHKFSAFASDIDLTAAVLYRDGWPRTIETNAGNGQVFQIAAVSRKDDIEYVDYVQALGCIRLRIFND